MKTETDAVLAPYVVTTLWLFFLGAASVLISSSFDVMHSFEDGSLSGCMRGLAMMLIALCFTAVAGFFIKHQELQH